MIKGLFCYDGSFDLPPLFGIGTLEAEAEIAYFRRINKGSYKPNSLIECCVIDCKDGESSIFCATKQLDKEERKVVVLTNSTFLLNFDRFTWDDEKQEFRVWFWDEHLREFRHINDLTAKDLRKAHNIVKMYHNGALDIRPKWREDDDED